MTEALQKISHSNVLLNSKDLTGRLDIRAPILLPHGDTTSNQRTPCERDEIAGASQTRQTRTAGRSDRDRRRSVRASRHFVLAFPCGVPSAHADRNAPG